MPVDLLKERTGGAFFLPVTLPVSDDCRISDPERDSDLCTGSGDPPVPLDVSVAAAAWRGEEKQEGVSKTAQCESHH